jgi:hypothetical protein
MQCTGAGSPWKRGLIWLMPSATRGCPNGPTGPIGGPHRADGRLRTTHGFSTCTDHWLGPPMRIEMHIEAPRTCRYANESLCERASQASWNLLRTHHKRAPGSTSVETLIDAIAQGNVGTCPTASCNARPLGSNSSIVGLSLVVNIFRYAFPLHSLFRSVYRG